MEAIVPKPRPGLLLCCFVLGACGGDGGTEPIPVSAEISLAPTELSLLSGSALSGAVRFPDAGASGAQYLVVAQLATGAADVTVDFRLKGSATVAASARLAPAGLGSGVSRGGAAQRFHENLRRMDAEVARRSAAMRGAALAAPPRPAPPPVVGDKRTFKVCGDLFCENLVDVPATALYVGSKAAIFVDDSAPSGGLTTTDLQQLGSQFDNELYPIDVAAFGSESDVDGNGVVIILLSRVLNQLSPKPDCEESFIVGFFLGADLAPGIRTQYNNGEVFYGLVPEPSPPPTRCARSVNAVKALLPSTFMHEFQHMIAFNQRVLLRGGTQTDVLWLSEALAETASELGGLYYDSVGNANTALLFYVGNFFNLYLYFESPAAFPVITEEPPGSLEARGAAWLFVRYLADRYGSNVLRQMTQTTLVGAANVSSATGTEFGTLLGRWSLANYASDLPGFAAPDQVRYTTWNLRQKFAELRTRFPNDFLLSFPLVPQTAVGSAFNISGTVASGSGTYLVVTQPANSEGFDLTFRSAGGQSIPSSAGPQLAVVRIN
jgi:hypothetical protein